MEIKFYVLRKHCDCQIYARSTAHRQPHKTHTHVFTAASITRQGSEPPELVFRGVRESRPASTCKGLVQPHLSGLTAHAPTRLSLSLNPHRDRSQSPDTWNPVDELLIHGAKWRKWTTFLIHCRIPFLWKSWPRESLENVSEFTVEGKGIGDEAGSRTQDFLVGERWDHWATSPAKTYHCMEDGWEGSFYIVYDISFFVLVLTSPYL